MIIDGKKFATGIICVGEFVQFMLRSAADFDLRYWIAMGFLFVAYVLLVHSIRDEKP